MTIQSSPQGTVPSHTNYKSRKSVSVAIDQSYQGSSSMVSLGGIKLKIKKNGMHKEANSLITFVVLLSRMYI